MWIADHWKDYAVLDCGGGVKNLERWGQSDSAAAPTRRLSGRATKDCKVWNKPNAIYHRSNAGGGKWEIRKLPEQWAIHYGDLTFQLKPMSFKHTGLFPEQAANWDFIDKMIRHAGRPINVLNLFATPAVQRSRRQTPARPSAMLTRPRAWCSGPRRTPRPPV